MSAFYNEIDPFAAAWLRELISAGHIAPGIVDERDIRDITPDELAGFTQCHFFAGIGVWSYALRRAGWPDDRPIWTGSCPCQPFSAAGEGKGFADERHLWPAFYHLIEQCEPSDILGEQVASGGTGIWFDLVQADLEAMGYAFGLVPVPAAGFGGAHIRDRAFWVADSLGSGQQGQGRSRGTQEQRVTELCDASGLADTMRAGWEARRPIAGDGSIAGLRPTGGLANASGIGRKRRQGAAHWCKHDGPHAGRIKSDNGFVCGDQIGNEARYSSPPMLGRDLADWLFCRDGKWRPVGPGTFPLAHEAPARVGRLRGYGNAIDAEPTTRFIEAVMDHLSERIAA